MNTIWTILAAVIFALIGKSIGRFYAKTHLTDDTSAMLTVAAHRASLKRVGRVAIGAFLTWLVMIALSSFIAKWITVIGWIPLILMNCCLAFLAGTAASLAGLLDRPFRWDAIQALIDQRERLIAYLKQLIPVLVFVVVGAACSIHAADACFFGVDLSPSVSVSDSHDAVTFLKDTAADSAAMFGCGRAVAVALGCEVRFARRVWLDVPAKQPSVDCSKAEPEPLTGHSRFWVFIRGVAESRKREAVRRCEEDEEGRVRTLDADRASFAAKFESAFEASDHLRCSRITASIRDALGSGLYRAIVVTSDMIDNPTTNLRDIIVPPGTRVIIILTRPSLEYARVEDSLARAASWSRIPGVTLVTTAELRSDLWPSILAGSSR